MLEIFCFWPDVLLWLLIADRRLLNLCPRSDERIGNIKCHLDRLIQNQLYVNQARVIFTYETKSSSGKKQFLYLIGIVILIITVEDWQHVLDSVLEPLVPKGNKIEDFVDIKAGDILRRSDNFRFWIGLFGWWSWLCFVYVELVKTLSTNFTGELSSLGGLSFLSLNSTARWLSSYQWTLPSG